MCAAVFGLDKKTIYNAKKLDKDDPRKFEKLMLPVIPRDKLFRQMPMLLQFFKKIPTKSGIILC
jgi:hypothetical protein